MGKTRLVTRVALAVKRSLPVGTAFAELGALPDPALADRLPMAVTAVKKAMDAAGHGWPTVRHAAGRFGIESDPSGARVVSASRPGQWALPTVFDFNVLMRHTASPINRLL